MGGLGSVLLVRWSAVLRQEVQGAAVLSAEAAGAPELLVEVQQGWGSLCGAAPRYGPQSGGGPL